MTAPQVVININGGLDPNAVARQIERLLAERRKAAQKRLQLEHCESQRPDQREHVYRRFFQRARQVVTQFARNAQRLRQIDAAQTVEWLLAHKLVPLRRGGCGERRRSASVTGSAGAGRSPEQADA